MEHKMTQNMVCFSMPCCARRRPRVARGMVRIVGDDPKQLRPQYGKTASSPIYIWNIDITSFISRLPYIVTIGFKSISNCDDVCSADSKRDDECSRQRSSWSRILTIMLTTQWLVIESIGLVVSIIVTIRHQLERWREHSSSRFQSAYHYGHNWKPTWDRMRPLW